MIQNAPFLILLLSTTSSSELDKNTAPTMIAHRPSSGALLLAVIFTSNIGHSTASTKTMAVPLLLYIAVPLVVIMGGNTLRN